MSPFGLFWQLQAALQAGAGGANCFQGPTAFVSQWGGGVVFQMAPRDFGTVYDANMFKSSELPPWEKELKIEA